MADQVTPEQRAFAGTTDDGGIFLSLEQQADLAALLRELARFCNHSDWLIAPELATRARAAAQGADEQLRRCVEWLKETMEAGGDWWASELEAAMRPKPPNELTPRERRDKALKMLTSLLDDPSLALLTNVREAMVAGVIALESLPEPPKPPSLKERALSALANAEGADYPVPCITLTSDSIEIIRRALDALPDD
jgi:hypothetical protein